MKRCPLCLDIVEVTPITIERRNKSETIRGNGYECSECHEQSFTEEWFNVWGTENGNNFNICVSNDWVSNCNSNTSGG
jgi:hypothetical protein